MVSRFCPVCGVMKKTRQQAEETRRTAACLWKDASQQLFHNDIKSTAQSHCVPLQYYVAGYIIHCRLIIPVQRHYYYYVTTQKTWVLIEYGVLHEGG